MFVLIVIVTSSFTPVLRYPARRHRQRCTDVQQVPTVASPASVFDPSLLVFAHCGALSCMMNIGPCAMGYRGDIQGCARLYQKAAENALPGASSPGVQQRLTQGLQVISWLVKGCAHPRSTRSLTRQNLSLNPRHRRRGGKQPRMLRGPYGGLSMMCSAVALEGVSMILCHTHQ